MDIRLSSSRNNVPSGGKRSYRAKNVPGEAGNSRSGRKMFLRGGTSIAGAMLMASRRLSLKTAKGVANGLEEEFHYGSSQYPQHHHFLAATKCQSPT
jgi:hypothetical protein